MLNGEYGILIENMWLTDILAVILLIIPFFLVFYDKKWLFGFYTVSIVANLPLIFVMSFGFSYEIIIGFFIIVLLIKDYIVHKNLKFTTIKESVYFIIIIFIIIFINLITSLFNFNFYDVANRLFIYFANLFIFFTYSYFFTNHSRLVVVKNGFVIGAVILVISMIAEMIYGYYSLNIHNLRPAGLLLDPNVCAFALNLALIISFFNPKESTFFNDLISVSTKLIMLFGVFLTVSRSGYISSVIILIMVLIFYSKGKKNWIPATTVSIFIIMYFIFLRNVNIFYQNITDIIDLRRIFFDQTYSPPGSGGGGGSAPIIDYSNSRLDIIIASFEVFKNNIITGVGIGNVAINIKSQINLEMNAHNLFLQLLAESGVLMLFGFIALLVFLIRLIKKCQKRYRFYIIIILIVLIVEGMFNHNLLNINIIWIVLAFLNSIIVINSIEQKTFQISKGRNRKKRHKKRHFKFS